jgi:hypothetical protein
LPIIVANNFVAGPVDLTPVDAKLMEYMDTSSIDKDSHSMASESPFEAHETESTIALAKKCLECALIVDGDEEMRDALRHIVTAGETNVNLFSRASSSLIIRNKLLRMQGKLISMKQKKWKLLVFLLSQRWQVTPQVLNLVFSFISPVLNVVSSCILQPSSRVVLTTIARFALRFESNFGA